MQDSRQKAMRVGLAAVILLVLLLAYSVYAFTRFRVSGSLPSFSQVSDATSTITINFNKPLSSNNLSVSSNPAIIGSSKVSNKSLVLQLNQPLSDATRYSITIKYIADSAGHTITNKTFRFTPRYVPYNQLPAAQQQEILQGQSQAETSNSNPSGGPKYQQLDSLIDYGLTSSQLSALQQEIFRFKPSANSVQLVAGSIAAVPHDRNSDSTMDTINFSLQVDSSTYSAKVVYGNLTEIHLYVYDAAGNQLFYSG